MALSVKSAFSRSLLTGQIKRSIVPRLNAAFSASNDRLYSSKRTSAMNEHEVVPDVIAVAPSDKIEVITFSFQYRNSIEA